MNHMQATTALCSLLLSLSTAMALPAIAAAEPSPSEGDGDCGQVVVFGVTKIVEGSPNLTCAESMYVANRMIALWPEGSRFVKFDHWSCAGVTAGEVDQGKTWDIDCESEASGGMVIFKPVVDSD